MPSRTFFAVTVANCFSVQRPFRVTSTSPNCAEASGSILHSRNVSSDKHLSAVLWSWRIISCRVSKSVHIPTQTRSCMSPDTKLKLNWYQNQSRCFFFFFWSPIWSQSVAAQSMSPRGSIKPVIIAPVCQRWLIKTFVLKFVPSVEPVLCRPSSTTMETISVQWSASWTNTPSRAVSQDPKMGCGQVVKKKKKDRTELPAAFKQLIIRLTNLCIWNIELCHISVRSCQVYPQFLYKVLCSKRKKQVPGQGDDSGESLP